MATIAANPTSELYNWQPLRGEPARAWTDDRSALSDALAAWLPWPEGGRQPAPW
jgi:hypothetical protein